MSQIILDKSLWQDLVAVAKKRQKKPETIAALAIQDYLDRVADEELLARSEREARRNGRSVQAAERAIKERRTRTER